MASLRANDAILDADFRVFRGCAGSPAQRFSPELAAMFRPALTC
jgi:hypothetical protein